VLVDDVADQTPVGWLSDVTLAGADRPVRVMLMRREGNRVIVRQVDPCDPEPERVPLYEGDELVVATAISHVSLHTTDDPDDASGFLVGIRVVEAGRENGVVKMRTLRVGEQDVGARVHIAPGESAQFGPGDLVLELDHIDNLQAPTVSGYVALTPTLATWFAGGPHDAVKVRYLLAAARRLDVANRRMIEIEECRSVLAEPGLPAPKLREVAFQLIGAVESAVIALGRAVDMVEKANRLIGTSQPVPADISRLLPSITAVRNAYEHIEDRALGTEFGRPHPDAVTIFDYTALINNDVIVYGPHRVGLTSDVPLVIQQARAFIKKVAADS